MLVRTPTRHRYRVGFWRATAIAAAVGVVLVWLLKASSGSWWIGYDAQLYYRCLPFGWYLVTANDAAYRPKIGELVYFDPPGKAEKLNKLYPVTKYVAGVEGDTWQVENDVFYINGKPWAKLFLMDSLDAQPGAFDTQGVVKANQVLVAGTNPSSYDSRYWGVLDASFIKGKAYALF